MQPKSTKRNTRELLQQPRAIHGPGFVVMIAVPRTASSANKASNCSRVRLAASKKTPGRAVSHREAHRDLEEPRGAMTKGWSSHALSRKEPAVNGAEGFRRRCAKGRIVQSTSSQPQSTRAMPGFPLTPAHRPRCERIFRSNSNRGRP